ncbi:MAG: F0F1 ATP synthase subunit gamma [Synechococcus sp.]
MALTPEALQANIESVEDLQAIVKTMKALASVSIQHYRKAVESLQDYNRTIEMGLQIVLQQHPSLEVSEAGIFPTHSASRHVGAIVWGSDRGLCGQFDERIVAFSLERLKLLSIDPSQVRFAAVGLRVVPPLEQRGFSVSELFAVPNSVTEIMPAVQDLLLAIEQWRSQQQVEHTLMFYNHPLTGASYQCSSMQLFPIDTSWLHHLQKQESSFETLPMFTMERNQLLSELIREYFFVSLYRAYAASLASENASRLSAMQSAESNIEERLLDLKATYHRQRQDAITSELLDIVSGFEALTE